MDHGFFMAHAVFLLLIPNFLQWQPWKKQTRWEELDEQERRKSAIGIVWPLSETIHQILHLLGVGKLSIRSFHCWREGLGTLGCRAGRGFKNNSETDIVQSCWISQNKYLTLFWFIFSTRCREEQTIRSNGIGLSLVEPWWTDTVGCVSFSFVDMVQQWCSFNYGCTKLTVFNNFGMRASKIFLFSSFTQRPGSPGLW